MHRRRVREVMEVIAPVLVFAIRSSNPDSSVPIVG
jgi:hypothetical protein